MFVGRNLIQRKNEVQLHGNGREEKGRKERKQEGEGREKRRKKGKKE
jgi:hypothetical protein